MRPGPPSMAERAASNLYEGLGKMFHSSRLRGPDPQVMQGNIISEKLINWC